MSDWHCAFAPATVANLGPGFDVLGLALHPDIGLGDTCEARLVAESAGITLTIDGDNGRLPTDPAQNCASVVARAVIEAAGAKTGLALRLHKGLPLGSGLGSSAASSAAAALATNQALGNPLSRRALINLARLGEALAAGTPHPDNVTPALLGGVLLMVEREGGLEVVRLPVPPELRVAVVIPELEVRTADARAVMPAKIPMADAVHNLGALGLLVSGLYEADYERLAKGLSDRLHQPYRIPLTRGFDAVHRAAMDAGAIGGGLSGSGPAMFAITAGEERAKTVGHAMAEAFIAQGISARFASGPLCPPLSE